MDITLLIQNGIIVSLIGTVFAGLIGLLFNNATGRVLSYSLLAFVNAIGAVASFLFLTGKESVSVIGTIPFGFDVMFRLDILSSIFLLIVTTISALCAMYAIVYVAKYEKVYHLPSLAMATALFIFGMQSVLLSMNIAGFMVSWEIMSVASFFLVMADKEKASIKAALFYLVMTHLGAGALFAGFFLLSNGKLLADLSSLAVTAQALPPTSAILALLLFLFGFGSKAGLVPFHVWLPEAHPQAPSHISALMSGVMLKVAVYGFLRIISAFPMMPSWFGILVMVLGLLSAVFGVLYAVIETDIKRTLAYSSIENIGLIFTMIGLALYAFNNQQPMLGELCLITAVFHSVVHAVFKSGLFLTAGAIVSETHSRSLEAMGGLAKRMPILSGSFLILALSAAALPPFGVFYGEWVFLQSVVGAFFVVATNPVFTGLLIAALAGFAFVGGLAIFAMVKLFAIACLGEPRTEQAAHAKDAKGLLLTPIIILTGLIVLFGAFAPNLLSILRADGLVETQGVSPMILVPSGGSVTPMFLMGLLILCVGLVWSLRRLFSNVKNERPYHTWDCGQPITSGMEYTATAFSAPIRFFFRLVLRAKKTVIATPLLATNPWIAKRTMVVETNTIFSQYMYEPIGKGMIWLSEKVRKIQNGSIQLYLALIFITLIVALMIAL